MIQMKDAIDRVIAFVQELYGQATELAPRLAEIEPVEEDWEVMVSITPPGTRLGELGRVLGPNRDYKVVRVNGQTGETPWMKICEVRPSSAI